MNNLKTWIRTIYDNNICAVNRVSTNELAACFNFLEIPSTGTIALTVSVMKGGVRKGRLDPQSFARLMKCVEDRLTLSEQLATGEDVCPEHFKNLKAKLELVVYCNMNCHRLFFIPKSALWVTIDSLFDKSANLTMRVCGVSEIVAHVNTCNHNFVLEFN